MLSSLTIHDHTAITKFLVLIVQLYLLMSRCNWIPSENTSESAVNTCKPIGVENLDTFMLKAKLNYTIESMCTR